nr:hypothetical protein [Novosphingobium panipatense]
MPINDGTGDVGRAINQTDLFLFFYCEAMLVYGLLDSPNRIPVNQCTGYGNVVGVHTMLQAIALDDVLYLCPKRKIAKVSQNRTARRSLWEASGWNLTLGARA